MNKLVCYLLLFFFLFLVILLSFTVKVQEDFCSHYVWGIEKNPVNQLYEWDNEMTSSLVGPNPFQLPESVGKGLYAPVRIQPIIDPTLGKLHS